MFFRRKKNETTSKQNEETKDDVFVGRTMVFKLKDGTLMCDMTRGLINKIETERNSMDAARKMYRDNYVGTYDNYKFKIQNGESLDILTNFSYEDIWKMWSDRGGKVGKDGYVAWGLKFEENDEEWNKQVMIMSMLLEFKSDKTMGTGNSELDKRLNHDFVLCSIGRLDSGVKKNPKKKMDAISKIKRQIEYYKLPENDEDKIKKIIDSI